MGKLDGQSYVATAKCNLSEKGLTVPFTVVDGGDGLPRLSWGEPTGDVTDDDLAMAKPTDREERSALDDAVQCLEALLAHGPISSPTLAAEAKRAGISTGTLARAKRKLGATSRRVGAGWSVCLPGQELTEPSDLTGVDSLLDDFDTVH